MRHTQRDKPKWKLGQSLEDGGSIFCNTVIDIQKQKNNSSMVVVNCGSGGEEPKEKETDFSHECACCMGNSLNLNIIFKRNCRDFVLSEKLTLLYPSLEVCNPMFRYLSLQEQFYVQIRYDQQCYCVTVLNIIDTMVDVGGDNLFTYFASAYFATGTTESSPFCQFQGSIG